MPKTHTFEHVKKEIENGRETLLSDSYVNNDAPRTPSAVS